MRNWALSLKWIGVLLGVFVIAWGIIRFTTQGAIVPLLISMAVIIAGPVEDILVEWLSKKGRTDQDPAAIAHIVDLLTSIGFLICLSLASILA